MKRSMEVIADGFDDDCEVCRYEKRNLIARAVHQLMESEDADGTAYSQFAYVPWSHAEVSPEAHGGRVDPNRKIYLSEQAIGRVTIRPLGPVLDTNEGHLVYLLGGRHHGDTLFAPWLLDEILLPTPRNFPMWTLKSDSAVIPHFESVERYFKTEWINEEGAIIYTHDEAQLPSTPTTTEAARA